MHFAIVVVIDCGDDDVFAGQSRVYCVEVGGGLSEQVRLGKHRQVSANEIFCFDGEPQSWAVYHCNIRTLRHMGWGRCDDSASLS